MNTKRIENEIEQPIRKASIPNGWSTYTLYEVRDKSDRYSFTGGPFGSDLKTEDYTDEGVRIIQLQNIGDGKFLDDYKVYTSKEKADQLLSCNIYPGEIIIAKMAEPLARACIIPNDNNRYLMASDGIRLKIDTERFDTYFILNMINSWFFRKEAIKKGTGTTRLRIGLSDLKNIKIIAPSLQEQKAISKIITVWDKAIELKEKLIEQKKEQKKGLMQKLLMGHLRWGKFDNYPNEGIKERINMIIRGKVPKGYTKSKIGIIPNDWSLVKAKEIFKNETNKNHNGELEVLSVTQDKGIVPRDQLEIDIKYDENSLSNYKKVEKGDFVISLRSFQGGIEYSQYEGIVSPAYTVLKSKKEVFNDFYKFLFKKGDFIRRLNSVIYGIRDGKQIGYKDFGELYIQYPDIEEQKKISNILSVAEKEIKLHQKELEKLQQQKKGLMQLLLTGKVRVKV